MMFSNKVLVLLAADKRFTFKSHEITDVEIRIKEAIKSVLKKFYWKACSTRSYVTQVGRVIGTYLTSNSRNTTLVQQPRKTQNTAIAARIVP